MYELSTTVVYASPGQPQVDRGSSSQKSYANGWTIALHVLSFKKVGMREGVLLSTMSYTRNCGVHCRHAGACGLPPRGQSIDYGMLPVASASLKRRGTEDFLLVWLGNIGSNARAPETE
jgi:hypothetical protein